MAVKGKSFLYRLATAMIMIVLLQLAIIGGALIASQVIPNLNNSSYELFAKTVVNRKNYLENEMIERWSSIDSFIPQVLSLFPQEQYEQEGLSEAVISTFLKNAAPSLVHLLRDSGTTGSFVILNDRSTVGDTRSCLYLKDYSPTTNDLQNNSDLFVLRGPLEVLNQYKIPIDGMWSYGISLSVDNAPMYYKPYDAAQTVKEYQHLGYWHTSTSLNDPAAKVMTYTKPLILPNGEVVGVIGVEIDQSYVYKMLPQAELSESGINGYALVQQDETGQYLPIMVQGANLKRVLDYNKPIELKESQSVVSLAANGGVALSTNLQEIYLYNKNTPFSNVKWYLMGIIESDGVTQYSQTVYNSLLMAILTSLGLGILMALAVGASFGRPTTELVHNIRKIKPGQKMQLESTGISEIDELVAAMLQLNEDVLNSVTKTDKIISMVNIEIGTFDYKTSADVVQVSQGLLDMVDLPTLAPDELVVDKTIFLTFLQQLKSKRVEKNICQYLSDPPRWLKVESVTTDGGVLGIIMDVTKEELDKRSIILERDYDALTGIYNRYAFQREYNKVFTNLTFSNAAFLMGDLDNLKYINDTYGHDVGDAYIRAVAQAIKAYFSNQRALFARMSGDEFYVFVYGSGSIEEIRKIIYDFYDVLGITHIDLPDGTKFKLKMSSGVSWFGKDSVNSEELVHFADFAMYQGKRSIKGGIREFEKEVYASDSYMLTGKEELYRILDEQMIEYVFQPIVWAETQQLYGYEALMRPLGRTINTPIRLIHLARAQGQLWKVEKNSFYMVLDLYKKYQDKMNGCKIFINSVPSQVLKQAEYEELSRLYADILDRVVIEIIESESINDEILATKRSLIESWKGMLALDDYGSGYANDISLLSLQPNIIKIDRFLIQDIETNIDKQAIFSRTITFAKERNILVLAEGVETSSQLQAVRSMGVDLVQGYYISRPLPLPNYEVK